MSKRIRKDPKFDGPFAPMCIEYIRFKRLQGYSFDGQIYILHSFDNFCKNYDIKDYEITEKLAFDWSMSRNGEGETYRCSRIALMRQFAIFLSERGFKTFMQPFVFRKDKIHTPYIFTKDEIKRIFQVVDNMEYSQKSIYQHKVYPIIYRMLYACGFRINEVLGLKLKDIDLNSGIVRLTQPKKNIERFVPMSDSLTKYCQSYSMELHKHHDEEFPFIFTMHSEHYCVSAIERNFRDVMWKAGIPYGGKLYGPRLHDLRHSFACHTLYSWVKNSENLLTLLPILSKYLGHSGVMSTQWYLRLTAEFYPDVTEKVNSYTGCVFPEVGGDLIEEKPY